MSADATTEPQPIFERPEWKAWEAQLLPCPFCGGAAGLRNTYTSQMPDPWCSPWCPACDGNIDNHFKPAEAIAAWNQRADTAELTTLRARAETSHRWSARWRRAAKVHFEQHREAMRLKNHHRQARYEAEAALAAADSALAGVQRQNEQAHRIIQTAYDGLVDHWGMVGDGLKDDFDYTPGLNQLRDMYKWLALRGDGEATETDG